MDFAQFSLTHQYPGDLGLISLVGNANSVFGCIGLDFLGSEKVGEVAQAQYVDIHYSVVNNYS